MSKEELLESRKYLLEDIKNVEGQSDKILAMKAKMRGISPEALKKAQIEELNVRLIELDTKIQTLKSE